MCQSTFFSLVVEELSAQVALSAGVATQQSGSTGTRNVYSLFIHTYIKHNSCDSVNAMEQRCEHCGLDSKKIKSVKFLSLC